MPILFGGIGLLAAALFRWVPPESPVGKGLASLLTKRGQYSLSSARLTAFLLLSLALIALGVALVATGH